MPTKRDREEMQAWYNLGECDRMISIRACVPLIDVFKWRLRNGFPSNYRGKGLPVADTDVEVLYRLGMSDSEIADQLDVTKATISYHRRKLGLPNREEQKKKALQEHARLMREAKMQKRQAELEQERKQRAAMLEKKRPKQYATYKADEKRPWLYKDGRWRCQLCWYCQRACGGCEWSEKPHEPVPGWTAEPCIVGQTNTPSFKITACPKFLREPDRDTITNYDFIVAELLLEGIG